MARLCYTLVMASRRNVNVAPERDPAVIVFTNRMKKARKMAALAIRWKIGYRAACKMTEAQWMKLAEAAGWPPKIFEGQVVEPNSSTLTRWLVLRMLAVRWKVKLGAIWL